MATISDDRVVADFVENGMDRALAPEGLSNDFQDDDRTDNALKVRSETYAQADDLDWLLKQTEPEEKEEEPQEQTGDMPFMEKVGRTVGEMAVQPIGGIRDAAQEVFDLAEWAAGTVGLEMDVNLPDIKEPKTTAGQLSRSITQFLVPFAAFSKALKVGQAATTMSRVGRAAGAGAAADFLAFDPNEPRFTNLIQELAGREIPIMEYLAADPKDGEIEGRFKNALEGLALGTITDGLFGAIKWYRNWKNTLAKPDGAGKIAEVVKTAQNEQLLRDASDLKLIGSADESAPLVVRKKAEAAAKAVEGVEVPDDILAKSLTDKGMTPVSGLGGDVYVNFARIDAPEDIWRTINDTAQAFSEDVSDAARGVRSNPETVLSADKIDAWDTLMKRAPAGTLNAEQAVAARQLWATSAEKLHQIAAVAAKNPSTENLFQLRRMTATHHAIQKEVIAARTETARALQSWAIPVGGNLERMRDMDAMLDRAGGFKANKEFAERMLQLFNTPGSAKELSKFVDTSVYAKTVGAIQEYWINALLSGPKTHMVNMMSNSSVIAMSLLERQVAGVASSALGVKNGVELGETAAQIAGLRGGLWDIFRTGGKILNTDVTRGAGLEKVDLPRVRAISSEAFNGKLGINSDSWTGRAIDGIGATVNLPGRALMAEDRFFKLMGYRMELHAQAHRAAMKKFNAGDIGKADIKTEIARLLDDPPQAIRMEAAANAAYQTFTSKPGWLSQGIQNLIRKDPSKMSRFILPFINTPGNILNYTFERTPLAPLTAKYRNAVARGGADAVLARTKMAMGTYTMMLATDLAMNGHITGSGPDPSRRAERQNWLRQGHKPHSIKVGDRYFAYNRMDPLGYLLGFAADFSEFMLNASEEELTSEEVGDAWAAATFLIAENVTSKSYLQGLTNFVETVADPERLGPSWWQRFGGSLVPVGVKEVATFMDPTRRHVDTMMTAMRSRVPALSKGLPPRRDLWGREMSFQSGLGATYDAFSPIYSSKHKPEPIDTAMEEDGWYIGMPRNNFTVRGQNVSLRHKPEIYSRFLELSGGTKPSDMKYGDVLIQTFGNNTLLETLNGMVTGKNELSKTWDAMPDNEARQKLTKKVVSTYRKVAKRQLFEEYPWIEETAGRLRAQRVNP